jgi:ubiquinone/menaquinone biosynthesis C-methylase UbiE
MTTEDQPRERYSMGYDGTYDHVMTRRSAADMADFLLPHLRPGMRVLDAGCGPGPITVDLAEVVTPGEVLGMDIASVQLERGRALAAERRARNVRFEQGDAYALPFPDASFDVVFASTLLQHLGEPARALREFRRVVRPGGLAAITDADWSTLTFEPPGPLLEQFAALVVRTLQHNGGSPSYAKAQRRLLLEAGFARADMYSRLLPYAPSEFLAIATGGLRSFAGTIVAQGWADAAELEVIAARLREWSERPDAQYIIVVHRAIAWVDA